MTTSKKEYVWSIQSDDGSGESAVEIKAELAEGSTVWVVTTYIRGLVNLIFQRETLKCSGCEPHLDGVPMKRDLLGRAGEIVSAATTVIMQVQGSGHYNAIRMLKTSELIYLERDKEENSD